MDSLNSEKSRLILENLHDNIDKYSYDQVSNLLSEFRILTREKSLCKDILDDRSMQMLVDCSRNHQTEAQKCLSNLILNYAHIRESLVQPYIDCVDSRLKKILQHEVELNDYKKSENDRSKMCEILYYDLRIIFLLSALCSGARSSIRDRLLEPILEVTNHEADKFGSENYSLIIEGLKTLFNLTLDKGINTGLAAQVIRKLFSVVGTNKEGDHDSATETKPDTTDELLVNLIHLLTNMPKEVYDELSNDHADKVLQHLDEQLKTLTRNNFKDTILPVLNTCANICRYKSDVRKRWFDQILKSTKDFDKRPEEYDTLRGRLVKLMTSVDVHIKDIAAEFLYALCGGDTEKFITYTGFGNSAAFLSTKGLLSQGAMRSSQNDGDEGTGSQTNEQRIVEIDESSDEKQYRELRDKLDPITGKIEGPKRDTMEMSEEAKEWHAHELANAIAKLSKIGIMKPMGINAEGGLSEIDPHSQLSKQPESAEGEPDTRDDTSD